MFQSLKIVEVNGLRKAELINLGKVNVICGKNNSGKSTLLKGISNKDSRIIGINADPKSIAEKVILKTQDFPHSHYSVEYVNKHLIQEIENTIRERNVYFGTEITDLANILYQILSTDSVVHHLLLRIDLTEQNEANLVLLPPKRKIEVKKDLPAEDEIQPQGKGILDRLFHLKNQTFGSVQKDLFDKISSAFNLISSGHNFDINLLSGSKTSSLQLNFALQNEQWVNADDCGLGLHELLQIIFFALSPDYQVVLIEEPENHLHPEMQRKLLRFLSEETDKQYFITTHSNIFLDRNYVNRVFFTSFESNEIKVTDATSRATILNELGYSVSDNLVSDLIILVEGSKDKPIIEEFLKKFGLDASHNIRIWGLGGDEMANQDLSVFAQNYKILAVIDQDPQSESARGKFEENCKKYGILLTRLDRYSIESYFSVRALKEVFNKYKPIIADLETISAFDEKTPIWKQLNIDAGKIKNKNREIAQEMTLEEISGTDFENFFELVEAKLKE